MILKNLVLMMLSLGVSVPIMAQVKKNAANTKAPAAVKQAKQTPVKKPATTKIPAKPGVKNPAAVKFNPNHTLLWEITGKGLTQPSYVFGTMHILCADDARLSAELKKVIKACNEIFFEVDMDDMQQLLGGIQFARMNDGAKLPDLLTPIEYERIKAYFDKNTSAMPFSMMNRFKPYFITALIAEGMMNCEKKKGMEELIMKEAKQYNKNIRGLETVEFQASLFDTIPYVKQAQDLLKYIDSIDTYKKTTIEMADMYVKQDLDRLDSLTRESDPGMNQYMDILLYDRNRRWVSEMPEHMFEMPTLFAVGAGHLPGENGVISLLKKEGFTVKPLRNRD